MNCCCRFGAAVSGEWPEFCCPDCEIHQGEFMADERCGRHKRAMDRYDLCHSYITTEGAEIRRLEREAE